MGSRDPRIDAYIENAAPFAKPILRQVRAVVHAACPDVEETLKWRTPTFMYHGILCGVAAFKQHCMLGFWKGSLIKARNGSPATDDVGRMARVMSVDELPSKATLADYVRQAMRLNENGAKAPHLRRNGRKPKPAPRVPADLRAALARDARARTAFEDFSPSHRREYVEWITEAKGEDTRKRRVATTIDWLRRGKPRNWKYLALAGLLFLSAPAAAQQRRPMTPDDVMALKTVSNPDLSPDGKWIVYTVSYADMKANERRSEIWLTAATGGTPRRFTGGQDDRAPAWSRDGKWIAFLSTRSDGTTPATGGPGGPTAQIYLISPTGGEAEKLTESKTSVTAFSWAPDSRRLAYVAQVPLSEADERRQKDKDDPIVVDSAFRYSHVWTIAIESRKAAELVKGDVVVSDPRWAPDSRRLAYTVRPTPKADDGDLADIMIASADSGAPAPRKLHDNPGPDDQPRWSPDGQWIAFNSQDISQSTVGFSRLTVIPAGGGTARRVSPGFHAPAQNITWAPDGRTLYFQATVGTTAHLFSVPVTGGPPQRITSGDAVYSAFSYSADGRTVAFTRSDLQNPPDVHVATLPGPAPVRVTRHNPQVDSVALGRGEIVRWRSTDGMEIEGLLIHPAGSVAGRRYPLITNVHGGPSGVWTQGFPGAWGNYAHVWAGTGWAVFLPNPRGSSGYGEAFLRANIRDWGGGDYQDIQTGIDELVRRGVADTTKLGQTGWSYGGYMTAWTLTQTNRFRALMVGAGLTNMYSMYSTNDLQGVLEGYFGGEPWDDVQAYSRASAMTFIKQAKTPTLIMHGQADLRVPIGQAQELYMGLRKNEVPARLVFYPREPHGLGEPRHQLDKMKREYAWFARHVLGVQPADTTRLIP